MLPPLPSAGSRPDVDAEQAPSGAFPCQVDFGAGDVMPDENGFTTAMVLRRMRRAGIRSSTVEKALDFLETCESEPPGAFGYWPPSRHPSWAPELPPDADDTAVITLELVVHGRRSPGQARAAIRDVLVSAAQNRPSLLGPPWWRAGAFPTWLPQGEVYRNHLLDCAVNANVVALMAVVDARDLAGYHEAVDMITAAVAWTTEAVDDEVDARVNRISPYYASPSAVLDVIDDAVWCGATELSAARDTFAELVRARPGDATALWRDAFRGPIWRSRAITLLANEHAYP